MPGFLLLGRPFSNGYFRPLEQLGMFQFDLHLIYAFHKQKDYHDIRNKIKNKKSLRRGGEKTDIKYRIY